MCNVLHSVTLSTIINKTERSEMCNVLHLVILSTIINKTERSEMCNVLQSGYPFYYN
jgi:hypothetical protein